MPGSMSMLNDVLNSASYIAHRGTMSGSGTHVGEGQSVEEVALSALMLGIFSGLSLPLAAYLGVKLSPVDDTICAGMMAFGAGALLFAVTVELYGHSLIEVQRGRMAMSEIIVTIFSALLGAMIYLYANRQLERSMHGTLEAVVERLSPLEGSSVNNSDAEERGDTFVPGFSRNISQGSTLEEGTEGSGYGSTSRPQPKLTRRSMTTGSKLLGTDKARMKALASFAFLEHRVASVEKLDAHTVPDADVEVERQKATQVAYALFLGLLLDGVPEGILMGFLAAERHLSPVLIISLFVANFPEAFSSSTLFIKGNMPTSYILAMWTSLCLLVGSLSGISCYILLASYPGFPTSESLPLSVLFLIAHIEGLTGGAMLACISSVMLPESFERAGKDGSLLCSSGFLCTAGFLTSVFLKTTLG
mmetsp:Transcript_17769/g.49265  ORF Transcript_17769/g.49265 Transcript_17769/m.49265 type:complete len:418 (-) Transcript_17769:104-1357(-)